MPKEKIFNNQYGKSGGRVLDPGDRADLRVGDTVPGDDSFVKIQWHREAGLVGLTGMRDSDDEVHNDRLTVWLDRGGVNAAIRTLQRAGRQTYGSDEW